MSKKETDYFTREEVQELLNKSTDTQKTIAYLQDKNVPEKWYDGLVVKEESVQATLERRVKVIDGQVNALIKRVQDDNTRIDSHKEELQVTTDEIKELHELLKQRRDLKKKIKEAISLQKENLKVHQDELYIKSKEQKVLNKAIKELS